MNMVLLQGRLGRELETERTSNHTTRVKLTIGTRTYVDGQAYTSWHRVSLYGMDATDAMGKDFRKGDLVRVEGELVSKTYKSKDGQMRYYTEVVAHRIELGTPTGGPEVKVDGKARAAGLEKSIWPEEA